MCTKSTNVYLILQRVFQRVPIRPRFKRQDSHTFKIKLFIKQMEWKIEVQYKKRGKYAQEGGGYYVALYHTE